MDVAARSVALLTQTSTKAATRAAVRDSVSPRVAFELITGRSAFEALEHEWNELFDRSARSIHVFQSFNFCWHWANTFLAQESDKSGPRLAILTARQKGRLVMIWPLVSERAHGITEVYWMGEPVAQYGDALIDPACDSPMCCAPGWNFSAKICRRMFCA